MSVIEGASISCKTMSDGTLRLSIDIEPRNAQAAFALFGAPGRAVALAALKDGAGVVTEPEPEKPKGGEWAKLAGMWCNDPDFRHWAHGQEHDGFKFSAENAQEAAFFIRSRCEVDSRVELDHDIDAQRRFNERIRYPFQKWMIARGIRKAAP